MTRGEYLINENRYMRLVVHGDMWKNEEATRALRNALIDAWHSLSPQDQAELDARPPVEGRPRFVSSTARLRPTLGFEEAVSGAADDAIEGG